MASTSGRSEDGSGGDLVSGTADGGSGGRGRRRGPASLTPTGQLLARPPTPPAARPQPYAPPPTPSQLSRSELAAFDPETAMVGLKLQVDHEKSGVHIEDAGRRAELRRLMELGQHYPSAFNAALVRRSVPLRGGAG